MYTIIYEHEEMKKNVYDGARVYCMAERINEEYLRSSIRESRLGDKPTTPNMVLTILILSIVGLVIIFT